MLGEQIGEERGKASGYRVLSADGPKVEVSFQAAGKILGIDHTDMGTYVSVPKAGGFLYGEGQGVILTKGGDMMTWVGQGVGKMEPGGAAQWRGAVYYSTNAPELARLNGVASIFEYQVDAQGNTSSKVWEWK
jgi:hypothetical protein